MTMNRESPVEKNHIQNGFGNFNQLGVILHQFRKLIIGEVPYLQRAMRVYLIFLASHPGAVDIIGQ